MYIILMIREMLYGCVHCAEIIVHIFAFIWLIRVFIISFLVDIIFCEIYWSDVN